MSQFEGSKNQVRCVDCTKLSDNRCTAKNVKVAPKKKRICTVYQFKGEYSNRTSPESMYFPPVDRNTRRAIQKALKQGIVSVGEDGMPILNKDDRAGFARTKTLRMPASTATATQLDIKNASENLLIHPGQEEEGEEDKLIWMPGDE